MIELLGIAKRAASRSPMEVIDSVGVSVEHGVTGDFRGKPGKRQVSILSQEAWMQACREIDADIVWTVRRANLLVKGVEFNSSDIGKIISIGEVSLEITGETDPCPRMEEQYQGLQAVLESNYRGGVCCQVIKGGLISVGDKVKIS